MIRIQNIQSENKIHDILNPDSCEHFTITNTDKKTARVGVIGDGSCLFHSLLFLLFYENYITKNLNERIAMAGSFRQQIKDKIQLEHFIECSNGLIAQIMWIDNFEKDSKINSDIITKSFSNVLNTGKSPFLVNSIEYFASLLNKETGKDTAMIKTLLTDALFKSFENYVTTFGQPNHWVTLDDIKIIEQLLNINIIICNSDNKIIDGFIQKRLTILLYNQGASHWEPVITLDENNNGILFYR